MQARPTRRETDTDASTAIRGVLERRNDELQSIREIFKTITGSSDLRSILDNVTRITAESLDCDSCSIYLRDDVSNRLVLKATTGLYREAVDVAFLGWGEGLTGWSAMHREAVAVAEAQVDPRFHEVPNTREKPFHSLLAVPMVSQDKLIGAMNVQTIHHRDWLEGDTEFVQLIADVVAGVIERAVLYEETERRMMDLSTVAEVSKAVVAPVYLDETLRVVTEMAAAAVGARRCSLMLLDEVERSYTPRAHFDKQGHTKVEPFWSPSDPPLRGAEHLNQPIYLNNVSELMRVDYGAWAKAAGLNTLLVVPLSLNKRTIGLMHIWAEDGVNFTREQQQLCKTLANQISLAIENAHLVGNAAIVKEMNHRVKNNLQNIVMLMQLQLNDPAAAAARPALTESINRIMSIAAVHDALAQEGFRLVDVKDVLQRVVSLVHANMARPDQSLSIEILGESLHVSSRAATALALSVNELVANAMEHAFVGRSRGTIQIGLENRGGNLHIEVRDDGVGRDPADAPRPRSLGLSIVETLVMEDLRGTFHLTHSANGTVGVIDAPISYS